MITINLYKNFVGLSIVTAFNPDNIYFNPCEIEHRLIKTIDDKRFITTNRESYEFCYDYISFDHGYYQYSGYSYNIIKELYEYRDFFIDGLDKMRLSNCTHIGIGIYTWEYPNSIKFIMNKRIFPKLREVHIY